MQWDSAQLKGDIALIPKQFQSHLDQTFSGIICTCELPYLGSTAAYKPWRIFLFLFTRETGELMLDLTMIIFWVGYYCFCPVKMSDVCFGGFLSRSPFEDLSWWVFFTCSPPHWSGGNVLALRLANLGLIPAVVVDHLSRLNRTSKLKIGTPVTTLPGACRYRVSAGTGWSGVSILWLGEIESLVCSFYLSVAVLIIFLVDPSTRYTNMLLGC